MIAKHIGCICSVPEIVNNSMVICEFEDKIIVLVRMIVALLASSRQFCLCPWFLCVCACVFELVLVLMQLWILGAYVLLSRTSGNFGKLTFVNG